MVRKNRGPTETTLADVVRAMVSLSERMEAGQAETNARLESLTICRPDNRRDTAGMRHFRIFLDGVGSYDVLAREVATPSTKEGT